jgi:hypothetical protein
MPSPFTVTIALALSAVSATLVAVTVWVPAVIGAVYTPEALIVPTVELPPAMVSTYHVTAVFVAFCTVAVNCVLAATAMLAEVGLSEILITGAAVTVTAAFARAVVLAMLVAVTV